ncbi:MAG: host attachment protein [Reyranellaceae bacterium]
MAKQVTKPRRTARLPEAPPIDPRSKHTLIVVTDGARARFLQPGPDGRALVPAGTADMAAPKVGRPTRSLVSDKAGRGFAAAGSAARHTYESRHDYRKLEKRSFSAQVAHVLDGLCQREHVHRVVLVAPRRSLGELRKLISPQVGKLVSHEVAKDLTTLTPTALRRALDRVLPTAVVASP